MYRVVHATMWVIRMNASLMVLSIPLVVNQTFCNTFLHLSRSLPFLSIPSKVFFGKVYIYKDPSNHIYENSILCITRGTYLLK